MSRPDPDEADAGSAVGSLDLRVLRRLAAWRQAGQPALLATVIATSGPAPRPAGSLLGLRADGRLVGSVSGGCIEDELVATEAPRLAAGLPAGHPPERRAYGAGAEPGRRVVLPCGGRLDLMLEFNPDAALLAELVGRLEAGQPCLRELDLADGQVRLRPGAGAAAPELAEGCLRTPFGPAWRLLMVGGGPLAEDLGRMALACNFEVTLCDPREGWDEDSLPAGLRRTRAMPDDAVREFRPDPRSAVVTLSHDPKLDDLALLEALPSQAFYVGALGSRRSQAERRARLREHFGLPEAALGRLRGPAGLPLGGRTPPEIAVSILAELLAFKHGVVQPGILAGAPAADLAAPADPTAAPGQPA